jgi:hypothetical protein
MIDINGCVRQYKLYSYVVNEWFETRKKLYEERIARAVVLSKLLIKYLKNIIRFSKERDSYGITNKTPEKKFNEILAKNNYDKFNKSLLSSPKYTSVSDLESAIVTKPEEKWDEDMGTSYEYIITLTYRQLLEEACKKRREELDGEKARLKELLADCPEINKDVQFKGQNTWLKELDALEPIIEQGVSRGWGYVKNKPRFE